MPFPTARERRIQRLYHWQSFNPQWFEAQLKNNSVYCSNPRDFNDPWDCRPFFNAEILDDPVELKKHIDWAEKVCRKYAPMGEAQIGDMRKRLQDPIMLKRIVLEHTLEMQKGVLERFRVYCLSPLAMNIRMWAHYGDEHRGICLEFDVENDTIGGALEVQYYNQFPLTRQYSDDLGENLLPLVAKSSAWKDENEYRLIAQERTNATAHNTLLTSNGHLMLPPGTIKSVIVGCEGPYDTVRALVTKHNVNIQVLRAQVIPNRYELTYSS